MVLEKTKRLYGKDVQPKLWKYMSYNEVLQLKIRLASERIEELWNIDKMTRDSYNIKECEDSIKKCRDLLKELGIT